MDDEPVERSAASDRLIDRLSGSGPTVGNWVSLADPAVAELYAELGSDLVLIDVEHTPLSLESVADALRAVDAASGDAATVVRVPDADATTIKRVLDLGVDGLMVPMVETADEADSVVDAMRYPPAGIRGVAASRANRYGRDLAETIDDADERLTTIVQIESARGVENADAIAAVDGIDSLFIGPADLSRSLGALGDWTGDRFRTAVDDVFSAARAADVPVGTLAVGDEQIRRWASLDFQYVVVGYDVGYLTAGVEDAMETYESVLGASE